MDLDRISPTLRPTQRATGWQQWHRLLFLHWDFDPAPIARLLPPELTLDTLDGRAYLGLVPFYMGPLGAFGLPRVPGGGAFLETNLRTYVHYQGRDPGVWFFSLEAANWLAVQAARTFWRLPYHYARMSEEIGADGRVTYQSQRRGDSRTGCRVVYRPTGAPAPALPGTREHFLAERYYLYAAGRRGLRRGQVHHRAYPLQTAAVEHWEETLLEAAGLPRPTGAPLAHYASGVEVELFDLIPVSSAA